MELTQGKKLLLLALCDHANDDGVCYSSQDKLMQKCGIGQTTLTNHIKWLEQVGILRRSCRQIGRSRKSDLYKIDLNAYHEPLGFKASDYEPLNNEASLVCRNAIMVKVFIVMKRIWYVRTASTIGVYIRFYA